MIYILIAAAIYLIGCFGVTMLGNVPLNNMLESLAAGSPEGQAFWNSYISKWTLWNTVRTIACMLAMLGFAASVMKQPT